MFGERTQSPLKRLLQQPHGVLTLDGSTIPVGAASAAMAMLTERAQSPLKRLLQQPQCVLTLNGSTIPVGAASAATAMLVSALNRR